MKEKEFRPWGWFRVLQRGDNYCVKQLWIEPEMRISLHQREINFLLVLNKDTELLVDEKV